MQIVGMSSIEKPLCKHLGKKKKKLQTARHNVPSGLRYKKMRIYEVNDMVLTSHIISYFFVP